MKRYSLFILLLLVPSLTFADTLLPTNATITENTHFVASSSPYIIEDYLNIQAGATLVIDPGVVVKLKSRYGCIGGLGNLIIGSNTGTRTYITSYKDDTVGGDSNGDGDTTVPTRDDWTCIGSPYGEGGSYTIENTTIRYGGNYGNVGMVNVYSTSTISNTTLEEFSGSAFRIAAHTTITDSKIQGGRKAFRDLPASLIVSNTSFENIAQTVLSGRYDSRFTHVIDVRNNWWGKDTGPNVRTDRGPYGSFVGDIGTDQQVLDEGQILYSPWLTSYPVVATTPTTLATTTATSTCTTACHSSILFLPGIMGTRLYDNQGERLWESFGIAEDTKQARLAMDQNGYSINEIHTKLDTVSDSAVIGTVATQDIYKSFIQDLQTWKNTDNLIQDYAVIPYDWRLPLDQIVQKGKVVDNKLYYGTTTPSLSDSFLIKELQRLQRDSKSGKVTIIAHSNGGLVTKELIQTLKETGSPLYNQIDKVIMVAVPQVGTPEAVLGTIHGNGLGALGANFIISNARARSLAQNMPMSYNLIPNQNYIDMVSQTDFNSKLITFDSSDIYTKERAQYGYTIDGHAELEQYITGVEGRPIPPYTDTNRAMVGNQILLTNAVSAHQRIDNWQPATTTKIIQVAGWGEDTVVGIDYKVQSLGGGVQYPSFKVRKTVDGDGTVVVPSALYMSTSTPNVERWWVDLKINNKFGSGNKKVDHSTIFESPELRTFLLESIKNETIAANTIIKTSQPISTNINRLHYTLHSPLTLGILDNQGRYTGRSTTTDEVINQIPEVNYNIYGEVQTISVPVGLEHTVLLDGYQTGSFSLDIDKQEGNTITASTTFSAIPTTENTIVRLAMNAEGDIASTTLKIDSNGDNSIDISLPAVLHTEVTYQKPIPAVASNGGGYYTPPVASSTVIQSTVTTSTSTKVVTTPLTQATTTKKLSTNKSKTPLKQIQRQVLKPAQTSQVKSVQTSISQVASPSLPIKTQETSRKETIGKKVKRFINRIMGVE
jgi:pimeloyl-ACP methyl ester carboxylesterase